MEVKYIPGDLVMTNGVPRGTEEGIIYRVIESNPDREERLKNGTILKGAVTLDNRYGIDESYDGYIWGDSSAWVKDIVPIPLTLDILEANGWHYSLTRYYENDFEYCIYDKIDKIIDYPSIYYFKRENGKDADYFKVLINASIVLNLDYVHQLQHLLFILGSPSELKV